MQHGKPVAFYGDIEIICADSPQAKGRVEHSNLTLQDRKCSPDPVSQDIVIRAIFAADASDAEISSTRDRGAA